MLTIFRDCDNRDKFPNLNNRQLKKYFDSRNRAILFSCQIFIFMRKRFNVFLKFSTFEMSGLFLILLLIITVLQLIYPDGTFNLKLML